MRQMEKVNQLVDSLIIEGEELLKTEWANNRYLSKWSNIKGSIGRRLKKLCYHNNCPPAKQRPTINDYNTNLYKDKVYDKIMFKNVDSMAAIGNNAAHNDPDLKKEDVERLLRDLNSFLQRFSGS